MSSLPLRPPPPTNPPTTTTLVANGRCWQWHSSSTATAPGGSFTPLHLLIENGIITKTSTTPISAPPQAKVIAAANQIILPGLIDSHIHVTMTGESKYFVDLSKCTSISDLKAAVLSHSKKHPDHSVIQGVGWDQEKLGGFPSSSDLDSLSLTDKTIWLWRACWHIGCGNSRALSLAKAAEWVGEGGEVERDASGKLTGVLKERACELVAPILGEKSDAESTKFILDGLDICVESGLTAVATNEMTPATHLYKNLHSQKKLRPRVFLTPMAEELDSDPDLRPFTTPDRLLKVDRVKIFGDGSLGAGTAAITPDDSTSSAAAGLLIFTDDEMERKVKLAKVRSGWERKTKASKICERTSSFANAAR